MTNRNAVFVALALAAQAQGDPRAEDAMRALWSGDALDPHVRQAEEAMRSLWTSDALAPKKKHISEGPYQIIPSQHRVQIIDGHGCRSERFHVRHLENKLRWRGLDLEERTALITNFFTNDYGAIAQRNLEAAQRSPYWEAIDEATDALTPHYKAFLQALSIQESLAGQYAGGTGGQRHSPAVGIYQVRDIVIDDAAKKDAGLKNVTIDDIAGVRNIPLQTRVIHGYVRWLEDYFDTSIKDNPEAIALAYNIGLAFVQNALAQGPEDISEAACNVKNFRDVINGLPEHRQRPLRRIFGPQKAMIGRAYGKAIMHYLKELLPTRLTDAKAY